LVEPLRTDVIFGKLSPFVISLEVLAVQR